MRLDNADENGIFKVPLDEVLTHYYMDYAKSTIVERAFPFIDGFKPVVRRVLYTMLDLKATGNKSRKCARIVGDTMGRFHPHGDSSIYGALVNLADVRSNLNVPLVRGTGSFGKSWSVEHFVEAAMRYTEASLTEIAEKELFNGINENAVDLVDNFSVDEKEPFLLPVSFPSLIVNNTNGIAVGMSTYIPTYALKNACEAVKAIINNPEISVEELADILGAPDFCTGGTIHITDAQKKNLVKNGAAKGIYLTGTYSLSRNQITIYELPYNTNVERFIQELTDTYKKGLLRGVKSIDNTSGRSHSATSKKKDNSKCKLKVEITVNKSADIEDIMRKIRQNTSFSNPISFYTKFVWWNEETQDFEYKECGILETLKDYWIPWRIETLKRQYTFRLEKKKLERHKLESWQLIHDKLDDIIKYARSHKKAEYKQYLMTGYKLDEEQADYIMSKRLYHLTTDEFEKSKEELDKIDADIMQLFKIVSNKSLLEKIILEDMDRIIKKYGSDRKCNVSGMELIEDDKKDKMMIEEVLPVPAWVGVTKSGGLKRVMSENDSYRLEEWAGDSLFDTLECLNTDMLLIFTSCGYCYKVPVHTIETSRGNFKDSIWKLNNRAEDDDGEIILALTTNNYSGSFTILYSNGLGAVIPYSAVSGPRSRYKSLYPKFTKQTGLIYAADKFYIVTAEDNAAYMDLTGYKELALRKGKVQFKLPRWKSTDRLRGFVDERTISLSDFINKDRFRKGYCVKMKQDRDYILNIITEPYDPEKSVTKQMMKDMEEEWRAAHEVAKA